MSFPFPGFTATGPRRRVWPLIVAYASLLVSCDSPLGPGTLAVGHVDVSPKALTLQTGDTTNLVAHVFDQGGKEFIAKVFWSTQDPTIATVNQSGQVGAVGTGATKLAG